MKLGALERVKKKRENRLIAERCAGRLWGRGRTGTGTKGKVGVSREQDSIT